MLRWLYIQLMWVHPAQFRYRFCDEMLEAFDLARGFQERLRLLLDGLLSVLRQWFLRTEFHEPWHPATASGPHYEPITFQQIEPYKPRRVALAQGGLMALLLLVGIVNAINHGGGKVRNYLIGMHRPGYGLIHVSRSSMEAGPLNTTVETVNDPDDPWRAFARSYFHVMRVLSTVDVNGDLVIQPWELNAAPGALRRLDLDHDGKLSPEECGFLPGELDAAAIPRYRRSFMSQNPVLAALDTDHDGEISASEIANSTEALTKLDFNNNHSLEPAELIPNPAVSQAAGMMTRFDTNDDGIISLQELSKADAASMLGVLTAADRNHDGMVTRGELIVEMAFRAELQQELHKAQKSLK